MGHRIDWQGAVVLLVVAWAFWFVGRRLWGQVAAFRAPKRRPAPPRPAKPSSSPLIQIQTAPPKRIRRPPADD